MPEFRSIPDRINAVQFTGDQSSILGKGREPVFSDRPKWLVSALGMTRLKVGGCSMADGYLWVNGAGGLSHAEPGDWICTRRVGDLFVVRGANFPLLYEPV